MDIFCYDCLSCSQDLIEPLLEVIKVSSMYKEEKELHNRAQTILNNRICHSREVHLPFTVSKELLAATPFFPEAYLFFQYFSTAILFLKRTTFRSLFKIKGEYSTIAIA